MEIRSFGGDAAPKIIPETRTIKGHAVVYGQESRVLYDFVNKRFFIEIIEPGAITEETLRKCDVKALLEHNKERMLARAVNGAGSLSLILDNSGLEYRFDAPKTQDGDYAIEMISRGDIFGSSFAYWTDEKKNVAYEKRSDGLLLRKVKFIDKIFDVSPVSDPAYMGTKVEVRSLDSFFEEEEPDNSYMKQVRELRSKSDFLTKY